MKISEVSIKRPVFATMMIAALLVMGLFSYADLPVELFPNVDFPFVIISTVYTGASAEAVETEVTKKIEEAANEISGVRHIQSRSMESYSMVFVEFQLEVDGAVAAQDVREKVAGIRTNLPDDVEEPVVSQYDADAQPILSLAIGGLRPPKEITQITKDKIKPRLEAVSGVGSVELIGGHEREILVSLNLDQMESRQVSVGEVERAVASANLEIPGGRVDEASREYVVRVMGKLTSVDQFKNIIVKNDDGTPIYLSDVALVKDTIQEQRSLSTFNGKSAVALNIVKQSGANVVELAEQVRRIIDELRKELPPDITLTVVEDNSVWITDSIHEILFNIQFGTFLAVLVIFLFLLDIRPTLITGVSIPLSIVATFTAMKFLGFSINIMTLMGLSLAVGILIDDSIVVVENIYRKIQEGEGPIAAAFSGTKEIGLAVAATTFTIVVVFLPVAFMEGIVGRFFYQFGMTVAIAVLISLFVAFSLVPMLTSRTRPPVETEEALDPARARGLWRLWLRIRRVLSVWNKAFDSFRPTYRRILDYSLHHRWLVMAVAVLSFVAAIFSARFLGQEWFTQSDQGKIYLSLETPAGTDLQSTAQRVAQVEDIINGLDEVANVYVTVGAGNDEVTNANMLVQLVDREQRLLSSKELVDSVRTLISEVPGMKFGLAVAPADGGASRPIMLSIRGEDRDAVNKLAHRVERLFRKKPGIVDIENTLEEGKPELQIHVDRKLADDLGLNVASISQTIRTLVEGDNVSRFKDGDEEYDVRVRLQERFRKSEDDIGRLLIESTKEVPGISKLLIPLNRVAQLDKQTAVSEYWRYDRIPEVRVGANVTQDYFTGTASMELLAEIDSTMSLPPGYSIGAVGEEEIRGESATNMLRALILAIVFIYLLLASQYESFSDPFSIMLSLPLSLIGAILGLLIFNSSLSLMSQIGIVMLMGLVTKNAILLIDFVKQQRRAGVDRTNAILTAGPVRLRPILMTTLATVFGMLPLALELGPGAEMRAPMARAVIGGMLSSTMLTLIVVPVVYTLIDDTVGFLGRLFGRKEHTEHKDLAFDQQLDSSE